MNTIKIKYGSRLIYKETTSRLWKGEVTVSGIKWIGPEGERVTTLDSGILTHMEKWVNESDRTSLDEAWSVSNILKTYGY